MARKSTLLLLFYLAPLMCWAEKSFSVVWNAPTQLSCKRRGVDIPLAEYGIIVNEGGAFTGSQIVIFYEPQLGNYPEILPDGKLKNGGLPQLVDLQRHLVKVKDDINRNIPDKEFTGYAVIDWEKWRPHWDRNWGGMQKYQELSRDLVRADHPDWSATKVDEEARKQFEEGAKILMLSTLELGKEMRPKGKWGFYLFPRCYTYVGQRECGNKTKLQNDHISWMFQGSTGIYPSGYLFTNIKNAKNFVHSQNREGKRVRDLNSSPGTPVLLYSRYQKNDGGFYTKDELDASMQLSIDMGMEGVIVWGSSASINTKEKCKALRKYIIETFGPYIKQKIANAESCSINSCNSHGRCIKEEPLGKDDSYICKCFSGYKGDKCQIPI